MAIPVESFFLDPTGEGTLQQRIQQLVAQGILQGRFRRGERLPSSRALARHLGVSRITVTLAYTELVADDYLSARGRSGYYVSENAPEPPAFPARRAPRSTVDWSRAIGQRFTPGLGLEKPADWDRYRYPFIYGQTDPTLFDHANWRLCALQALGRKDFAAMTADQFDGDDPQLVDFIARQILPRRGVQAGPDEILVTMGAQNALWLAAQVLLTQRRVAAIENPCYPALRAILTQSRCQLVTVPVDGEGIVADDIPAAADVVFVTPSHQCPTNATLSLSRRAALLARAEDDDFLIVEDDYDFEMAFLKPPSPALKALDQTGRVIYVGSFSKSIFPGLRLGYLAGPAPFIREARALRASVLRHPPGQLQRTVAYFLSRGHYDALVRRTGQVFHARRQTLEEALAKTPLKLLRGASYGGSSVWVEAPQGTDCVALAERLRAASVLIEPGAPFFAETDPPRHYFRLAYSSIPASRIAEGVQRIAAHVAG